MFIPVPTQDLHLLVTQKLEASPVVPVSAVPGVAEESQSLDSRVALQWTQPVFAGAEGQADRSALAAPLPEALLSSPKSSVPGYEPQGADPDALQFGDVHPLLAQGLSNWISGVLAKPSGNANVTNLIILMAKVAEKDSENASPANEVNETTNTTASAVMGQLKKIYKSIAGSDVFAAQRLNDAWMPRKVVANSTFRSKVIEKSELENFLQLAQPIQAPSTAQLRQWVSALEPDSDSAEQAAQMLTQGNMVWQAELAPGVPMQIIREDAWRNNPQQAGEIEKGAMLKVETTLPNLGKIRIVGSQWEQDISLHISHESQAGNGKVNWSTLKPMLIQELKTQGLKDVKIESLSEAVAMTASNDLPKESPNV